MLEKKIKSADIFLPNHFLFVSLHPKLYRLLFFSIANHYEIFIFCQVVSFLQVAIIHRTNNFMFNRHELWTKKPCQLV